MRFLNQGRQLLNRASREKLLPLLGSCRLASTWNYEHEKKNFKLKAPTHYNFARDVVDKWAEKEMTGERGNNPAFWWVDDSGNELKWSYRDVSYQSKLVANVLKEACKLETNDVVIVILPRIPQWWAINVGAIRAGIILSPGTTLLRSSDIKYRINASNAKCVITNAECAGHVDEVAEYCPSLQSKIIVGEGQVRSGWQNYEELVRKSTDNFQCVNSKSDDPMTVFFTSGTTGAPKMTEHSHSSYGLGHLITARYFLELSTNDVLWNLSDTGWAKCAWSSLFSPWIAGACVFVQDSPKFDPQQALQTLNRYPVSHFCAPPTAVRFFVKSDMSQFHSTTLRHCLSAGEPVNPELLEEWEEGTGLKLYEGYGQTETTFLCGTYKGIEQRPGSMGKAAPGYELQIVNDEGKVLPRGKEGNIGILCKPEKPCGLFTKYIDDEERMRSVFVGDYYLTGDRAYMDDDDYVWFVGRADDVIISSGYRIGPFEVESALLEHPAVLESAVVSSPDYNRGEVVKAFVTLTEPFKMADKEQLAKELQEHAKQVTAPYKYPRKIEFVDTLPKTVSGKIRRVELRNKEWGRIEE
ncbi:acyl-coenzyme A synthetase ACSM3, mitochondrial-like isoform X2 [Ruditapes philippinarum]|uniref:acyl-coenzyme A synthetase ACSM3, mitochondrial-like isoform X2 n=1 Tax=Ruditapes philippinarum TaxID=129788 RepID=UPI00295A7E56|nr:acyl-coenzyme A synthetase ACSM3, mitochondrial-like isoform X2 [Ruditapes philippinarum]